MGYMLHILKNDTSWEQQDIHIKAQLRYGKHSYIVVNNYLVVSDAMTYCSGGQEWYIFDPHNLKWSSMGSLAAPRPNFSVYWDNQLHALGGQTGPIGGTRELTACIEMYDFQTNTWCHIPTKLPIAQHARWDELKSVP